LRKERKPIDAERFYQAVLQVQPLHPDANHDLGVLAVLANKIKVALPLFQKVVRINPKIEQFWLNYIDAPIIGKRYENAKQVAEQAKTRYVAE